MRLPGPSCAIIALCENPDEMEIAGIDPFDDCDFCWEIVDFDKMS